MSVERQGSSGGLTELISLEICEFCHMGRVTDASVNGKLCFHAVGKNFRLADCRIHSAVPGIQGAASILFAFYSTRRFLDGCVVDFQRLEIAVPMIRDYVLQHLLM